MLRRLSTFVILLSSLASAATVTQTLADFDGVQSGPTVIGIVDTFNYLIPVGATITSATFSGTWGTQVVKASTAPYAATIEGDTFDVCVDLTPCINGTSGVDDLRPFSFNFSAGAFAGLLDGSADLFITQTAGGSIRLGSPTLTINYELTSVPEPGSLALLAGGLAALGAGKRRRG